MEYYEPPFHAQYQQDHIAAHYPDLHHYNMVPQHPMIAMPAQKSETKPRLGKDEVEILEREFKKNQKPTTQTKRQFADDMGVELARINVSIQEVFPNDGPLTGVELVPKSSCQTEAREEARGI